MKLKFCVFLILILKVVSIKASISCTFFGNVTDYRCILGIYNTEGRDDFEEISGQHFDGLSDTDVLFVSNSNQNTRNLPRIICRSFPRLTVIDIITSNIQEMTARTLQSCFNLRTLNLWENNITALPANLLRNNFNLRALRISRNQVLDIDEHALSG